MDTIEVPAYPGNSKKDRGEAPPASENKLDFVPSAKATPIERREEGFFGRIANDAPEVKDFFIYDIFLPAAKNLVSEIVRGTMDALRRSVDEALFGGDRDYRVVREHGRSYVSYDKMSKDRRGKRNSRYESKISGGGGGTQRRGSSFESPSDVPIDTKLKAEDILSKMISMISRYGQATVGDFYDLADITSESFTDRKWGWTYLGDAYVERGADGYYLKFPDPKPL